MKEQINHKEQIERYLLNRMTEEEETLFQEHLIHCKFCQDELIKIRLVASVVALEELYKSPKFQVERERLSPVFLYRWFSVAACFLILIGISFFLYKKQSTGEVVYSTSIEYQHRAVQEKMNTMLHFPMKGQIFIEYQQPVCFIWEPSSSFHLKVYHKNKLLLDIEGNGERYVISAQVLTSFPIMDWVLVINEQTYSGQIIVQTNN